jgi:hypothetical protein
LNNFVVVVECLYCFDPDFQLERHREREREKGVLRGEIEEERGAMMDAMFNIGLVLVTLAAILMLRSLCRRRGYLANGPYRPFA